MLSLLLGAFFQTKSEVSKISMHLFLLFHVLFTDYGFVQPLSILCRSLRDIDTYTMGFPRGDGQGHLNIFRAVKNCLPGPVRMFFVLFLLLLLLAEGTLSTHWWHNRARIEGMLCYLLLR